MSTTPQIKPVQDNYGDPLLVPTHTVTITIPALLRVQQMHCMVSAKNKAMAVHATLNGEISEACPASILRTKKVVILYLDRDSALLLDENKE